MAGQGGVVYVTGASSQLGVFLLPRLRDAGFRVLALSRKAPPDPVEVADGVSWLNSAALVADGEQVQQWSAPDHLISCGPLELGLRLVLRHTGLQRVVAFSSSSVLSKAASPNREERRRMATMAADEAALINACAERGLPLLLLRPTLIYGCGLDRNVSLLARWARRFAMIPLAGPASGLRQPVHADDLAQLAVSALRAAQPLAASSPACGGETLSYREMAARIAALQSRPVRLLSLPEGLMALLVRMLAILQPGTGANAEMVRRQNRDLMFDDGALRLALDWAPRPFEPCPGDFEVPDYARALQLPEPSP
jgi:nucleoside-diphosphate-sugar epimerase